MESLAKDVWTRRPDTPSEGGGKWVFFIRITYPDMICYRLECDRRECRVLLPEGVRIGKRAAIPPGCITSGILLCRHSTRMSHIRNLHRRHSIQKSAPPPFHPAAATSTRMYHIRKTTTGWERRAFQLPQSHISGSAYSAYPESFATIFCTVLRCLLKLPDMCD